MPRWAAASLYMSEAQRRGYQSSTDTSICWCLFDVLLGGYIEHRNGDKTTVHGTGHVRVGTAVSSSNVMKSGAHYAEFLITGAPYIGIVRPMPGLDASAYQEGVCSFTEYTNLFPDFRAQTSDEWGNDSVHACEYYCKDGEMFWTNWDDKQIEGVD
ncbi:hypothetical protein THAOC_14003 [Thalassiosira oceanica]|uniref:Uncharacterized protein n=1 Tax=Thalassiosira oceanica TaxID=159749 RepID=K0SJQ1_THAOC|nr:hypothetical protein THAOC_14003 [Thalassiosira oceanica]|eukprot:EJK65174.1 hypothetical protein THAOC_14003 [Thalassiosira oceanica]